MSWDTKFYKGFHIEELKYYSSPEHSMLGINNGSSVSVQNIGKNGNNMTFAVLSMNRSTLTIRLMDSIKKWMPEFAGEFLIGDNGSVEAEKAKLRKAMEQMPYKCRMVEFGKNYGVAGGRNRLYAEVQTEWILQADNDVYFVGNPLEKIQQDVARLGCHFMSVPVLNQGKNETFVYGGHLYVEDMQHRVSVGGGSVLISPSVEPNREHEPFLCTFLSGCVSLIKKSTFFQSGGFDDGMFVGFEDTEFSVRLFQQGYKIGTCGVACVIHDHPKPEKKSDSDYEKNRFSKNHLYEAAKYFEKKHGFCVWNPMVESWVDKRINELVPGTGISKIAVKKKIALVVDRPHWALDHIADQVIKMLNTTYEFKRIYLSQFDNLADILLLASECQLIHFLWRPIVSTYFADYTQNKISALGMTSDDFSKKYIDNTVISVGIYDHLLLEGKNREITQNLFSNECSIVDSYTVSTSKIKKIYDADPTIIMKPAAIIPDGVDLTAFRPKNLERFENPQSRKYNIGWVGNSKWEVMDLKGINTIIRPAIKILRTQGYNVELVTSDQQDMPIPFENMPDYYAMIDIYVCASLHEGTPNPVLEAMACGVPVVSTDVGLVSELFGNQQSNYILKERSVKCLVETLKLLLDKPERLSILSKENLNSILSWDWEIMTDNFSSYFEKCFNIKPITL
ncbi:glycosyltransferase [Hungatella effluvii]|jgi:glycosyltransferase involved in cell wall biosynthesis|uniref:glycosyltransferase n=1 Tax=Hungatella effluvii TaxID=1096246 RepID=UPI001F583E54|nr:glycosyltransferase [Hungatella effluvii]